MPYRYFTSTQPLTAVISHGLVQPFIFCSHSTFLLSDKLCLPHRKHIKDILTAQFHLQYTLSYSTQGNYTSKIFRMQLSYLDATLKIILLSAFENELLLFYHLIL